MTSGATGDAPASAATGLLIPDSPAPRPGPAGARMRLEEILLLGWAAVLPLSIAASQIMLGLFAAALDNVSAPREDPVSTRLETIDIDDVTPRQALDLLAELKALATKDGE